MLVLRPPTMPLDRGAVCLGAFDGMHLGHQALLKAAFEREPWVCLTTFEPRPIEVLAPAAAPPRLQTPQQRERVCAALGVDALAVLRFDRDVARTPPEQWARETIVEGLRPKLVVVGADFHYGRDRAGSAATLGDVLRDAGIRLHVVEKLREGALKVGSTAIRERVRDGDVEGAASMLGRWYAVSGTVRSGAGRGRELGFRTANIVADNLVPAPGVYAGRLRQMDGEGAGGTWAAACLVGPTPTFGAKGQDVAPDVEVHAIDADLGDSLYGARVEFAFARHIRPAERFGDADSLKSAIAADVELARSTMSALDDRCDARSIKPSSPDGGAP